MPYPPLELPYHLQQLADACAELANRMAVMRPPGDFTPWETEDVVLVALTRYHEILTERARNVESQVG